VVQILEPGDRLHATAYARLVDDQGNLASLEVPYRILQSKPVNLLVLGRPEAEPEIICGRGFQSRLQVEIEAFGVSYVEIHLKGDA